MVSLGQALSKVPQPKRIGNERVDFHAGLLRHCDDRFSLASQTRV